MMDLEAASRALGLELPPGASDRLARFADLLRGRGVDAGVVAGSDRDRVMERHVIDSLRALTAVEPGDRTAYDLGSGGGLPGIVVAAGAPRLHVGLVDSKRRRVGWLELVVAELALSNVDIHYGRVEDLVGPTDLCFARAFAPLPRAWEVAKPLLNPGGRLVYFAGREAERPSVEEIAKNILILEHPTLESSGPLVIIPQRE